MDTRQTLREFITKNFFVPPGYELSDDTSLVDTGLIDSTGMLEVISYLEGSFGISVSDAEMVPDNLGSISNLAAYIQRKSS